jgi:hypothetical protein
MDHAADDRSISAKTSGPEILADQDLSFSGELAGNRRAAMDPRRDPEYLKVVVGNEHHARELCIADARGKDSQLAQPRSFDGTLLAYDRTGVRNRHAGESKGRQSGKRSYRVAIGQIIRITEVELTGA